MLLLQLQHVPAFTSLKGPAFTTSLMFEGAADSSAPRGGGSSSSSPLSRCFMAMGSEDTLEAAYAAASVDSVASLSSAAAAELRRREAERAGAAVAPLDPMVICGPSGVGKNTLIEALLEEYGPEQIEFAVSHTTRPPRLGERDGVEYHFVDSAETMRGAIDRGDFIEHAEVHGNLYGTSRAAVQRVLKAGKICVLDIDVQGVRTLQARQARLGMRPRYVFVAPPSVETLRARLSSRATESTAQIQARVTTAASEVAWGTQNADKFDSVLVNDDLDTARTALVSLVQNFYPHLRPRGDGADAALPPSGTRSNSWRFPSLPRFLTNPGAGSDSSSEGR
jgi:guanylate kinase